MSRVIGPLVFLSVLSFAMAHFSHERNSGLRTRIASHSPRDRTAKTVNPKLNRIATLAASANVSPQLLLLTIALVSTLGALLSSSFLQFPTLAPFGLLAGAAVPGFFAKQSAEKSKRIIGEQSDAALGIVSNALRAGASFAQAIERAAAESPAPISGVFTSACEAVKIGAAPAEAMLAQAKKTGNHDLAVIAIAAQVLLASGGNMAQAIDSINAIIRERRVQARTLQALTAQGRLSAVIITAIPFVAIGAVYLISPDYFTPMFTSTAGRIMFAIAIVQITIGWIIIKRITTFVE